jgi:hypothetical protein
VLAITLSLSLTIKKIGAVESAKHHWRNIKRSNVGYAVSDSVFVLEAADKTKPALFDEFFKEIHNPPDRNIIKSTDLIKKPKATLVGSIAKDAHILRLAQNNSYSRYRSTDKEFVWKSAGTLSTYDKSVTHYYIELSGFTPVNSPWADAKTLQSCIRDSGLPELNTITIFGVRRAEISAVSKLKNWIRIDQHVIEVLSKLDLAFANDTAAAELVSREMTNALLKCLPDISNANSPFTLFYDKIVKFRKGPISANWTEVKKLLAKYPTVPTAPLASINDINGEYTKLLIRYPLLETLLYWQVSNQTKSVAEYINGIDLLKGV